MSHHSPDPQALASFAHWLGLAEADRSALWTERFTMNAPELAQFRAAADSHTPYYVAAAIQPDSPPAAWSSQNGAPKSASRARASRALQAARESQSRKMSIFTHLPEDGPNEVARGYLNGEPVAVKDMIGVQGMPRTGGSASSTSAPFHSDSAAVALVKQHGGAVIGLTTPHELAFGANSDNPVYGRVINPITPERIPGGSSGGSAAAVAAGIVDVALGTDTGGSVRIPAACCGVVGFKPSYNAVSREGVIEIAPTLDHIGPIGKSVDACARMFAALTDQPASPGIPDTPLHGLKLGVLGGFFADPLSESVRQSLQQTIKLMEDDGAGSTAVAIGTAELAPAIYFMTVSTEAAESLGQRVRETPEQLGEDVRVRLEMASFIPGHWYLKAQRLRRQLAQDFEQAFAQCDVLICPVMRAEAPKVGEKTVEIGGQSYPLHTAVSNLTLPFSLAGLPAIALPSGLSPDGAPLSIQLIAAQGKDWKLLEVAKRVERLLAARE